MKREIGQNMVGFIFSLGEKQNTAGEVEIKMRIVISRTNPRAVVNLDFGETVECQKV